ncbi:MAG: isoprenyl transferase [Sporomusaceae bacterium]|nr:isoprenyl transferase [Sporomusaceae bacterium]
MLKWFLKRNKTSTELSTAMKKLKMDRIPKHIAIIMDGNGRWAQNRGLLRSFGHKAGAETLKKIVRFASDIGVGAITAYAFSTENWKRPKDEVDLLMQLFSSYLDNEVEELHQNQVRIIFSGDLSKLSPLLQTKMNEAVQYTAQNQGLVLNLAVNYGGRAELVQAFQILARQVQAGTLAIEAITEESISDALFTKTLPDPELLIRPSGDQRISNFLLWQSAYTEFWFTKTNWPDFTPELLVEAILDYQKRDRRFGGLKK